MSAVELDGAVVIVTGASRGLGRIMSLALADAGARIVLASPEEELLAQVAQEIESRHGAGRALAVPTDITRRDQCERLVDRAIKTYGSIQVLVNNAKRLSRGPGLPAANSLPYWETNPEIWCESVNVNVCGTFMLTRTITPHFLQQKWGRIINITTSLVTMQRRNYSPYGVTKAALEAATMIWAQDLEGTGVTVNSLIPGGPVDLEPGVRQDLTRNRSLERPDVMNPLVVWLASRLSDGVTGKRFVGKLWDDSLPPTEAAMNSIEAPVLRAP